MDDLHWYVSKFLEKRQFRQFYRDVSPMRNNVSPSALSSGVSSLSKCDNPSERMEKCLRVCRSEKLGTAHGNPQTDCHGNVDQVMVLPKMKCCSLRNVAVDSSCCFQLLQDDKMLRSSEFQGNCSCESAVERPSAKCCCGTSQKQSLIPTFVSSTKATPLPYSCSCPEITPRPSHSRSGESYPHQDLLYVDITCGCIPKSYTCENIVSKGGPQREADFSDDSFNGHPASPHRRHSNDSCLAAKRCVCPVHSRDRCSQSSVMSPLHTFCIYQNLLSNGHLPKSGKLAPQHMVCFYPEAACRASPKRLPGRKMSPLCRSCTFHEMPARESVNSSSVSSLCETLDKAIATAGTVKQFLRDCSRDRHKLMNETGSRKLSEPNIRRYGLGMVHNASW